VLNYAVGFRSRDARARHGPTGAPPVSWPLTSHLTKQSSTLSITAKGVIIRNSLLSDVDVNKGDSNGDPGSFTIVDSTVSNGARDQCACVGHHDFTALRVNVVGANRSIYWISQCSIQDSWLHGQMLQGAQHGSGLRVEEFTTATPNSFARDFAGAALSLMGECSH
jgi:hypothetical protein